MSAYDADAPSRQAERVREGRDGRRVCSAIDIGGGNSNDKDRGFGVAVTSAYLGDARSWSHVNGHAHESCHLLRGSRLVRARSRWLRHGHAAGVARTCVRMTAIQARVNDQRVALNTTHS